MACDSPLSIKYDPPMPDGKGGFIYYFPADCGKCLNCLNKRKRQWSFRMTEQKRVSFSSYFVTLTYSDEYLPMTDTGCTVNKNDHFHFIKELKKYESPKMLALRPAISIEEHDRKVRGIPENGKLKYYGVSEYGDLGGRSHWHYILFNVRDLDNIRLAWPFGKIEIDPDVNVNNIDYVLKYMVKDHTGQDYEDKSKELSFMSKGLGESIADDQFKAYINQVNNNLVINTRGRKLPIPRYYRKKFLSEEVRLKKNQYIADQVEESKLNFERSLSQQGIDPFAYDVAGKEHRAKLLKDRNKRKF